MGPMKGPKWLQDKISSVTKDSDDPALFGLSFNEGVPIIELRYQLVALCNYGGDTVMLMHVESAWK